MKEYNTEEEIEYIIEKVEQVICYLRRMSPVWKELLSGERKFIL